MIDPRHHLLDRRTLLTEFGRGAVGIAVFGLGAFRPDRAEVATTATTATTATAFTWARANLGFVSAYVLARGNEAVIVDTGVRGSGAAIEKAVRSLGLSWSSVRHVIVTHAHPDHMGSVSEVMTKAMKATASAGVLDAPNITSPRAVKALKDGDALFGLTIIDTPGHTPGHISILEPVSGILVAGDALRTSAGAVVGPDASYTADMAEAQRSVAKLAKRTFATLLPGHGDPITKAASVAVAKLAAG